jgi:hypothetical protein
MFPLSFSSASSPSQHIGLFCGARRTCFWRPSALLTTALLLFPFISLSSLPSDFDDERRTTNNERLTTNDKRTTDDRKRTTNNERPKLRLRFTFADASTTDERRRMMMTMLFVD